jgi:hypothetical protein
MMAFRVGQKVVLVGWVQAGFDSWRAAYPDARYPNVGDVYTVREIAPWKDSAILLLQEIDNRHLGLDQEPGIRQEFYRPAVEPKADISVFTVMLTGGKKRRVLAQGE